MWELSQPLIESPNNQILPTTSDTLSLNTGALLREISHRSATIDQSRRM